MENKTKKIIVKNDNKNNGDISLLIDKAIEKNLPVETMERLFNLYKEVKADKARGEFVVALSKFQNDSPIIKKDKKVMNKNGITVRYMYAPLDSVIEQIKKVLGDNGLSYTWDSVREEAHIKVVCKLIHIAGHFEQSTFDIPIMKSEFMSSPQSYATAQSYAKRYTLLNVLGIGTADDDNDANDSDNNKTVKSEKARVIFLLKGLGEKVATKEQIMEEVKRLTQLELSEKSIGEVINRLEVLTSERQGL